MENGFFLITGTSKGIGEALARKILEQGHTVLGVSRNPSKVLHSEKFHHLSFNLSNTTHLDRIMEKVNEIAGNQNFNFICLVNNASATEPIGPIENYPADQIESHVKIGLIAPMILTSLFIRKFSDYQTRKKIAFISSGAAVTPMAGLSVYCGTKAGINMLAQCVAAEQKDKQNGFEVISIGPGMVDTPMQQAIRSKSSDEFALVGFFKRAFDEGKVREPTQVAEKIYTILDRQYEQGKFVSVSDV